MNNKKDSSISIVLKTLGYFLPRAWSYKKGYFFVYSFHTLFSAVQPFFNIIFTPLIITELMKGSAADFKQTFYYALLMIVCNGLNFLLTFTLQMWLEKYEDSFQMWAALTNSEKCMDMDFYLTEDKKALDQIEKARQGMQWYSGGIHGICTAFFKIISNFIKLLGVVVIISTTAPWLLLVTVIIIFISAKVQKKLNNTEIANYKRMSGINRIFGYVLFQLADFQYAKDVRLYNARNMFLKKTEKSINDLNAEWKNHYKETNPLYHAQGLISVFRDFITYGYLGYLAITNVISVGIFQQMLSSASVLHFAIQDIVTNVQDIVKKSSYAYEFVKFMEYPSNMQKGDKTPLIQNHTIEFSHVSFKYPGSEKLVLKDVSIKIEPGEKLSIVGLNGEGKTTFIKLLCRLYDVTGGEILLDGININEYSIEEYSKLIAVVFQDFKLFAFSIRENVTIGKDDNNLDALYTEIGLKEKLDTLSKKDETMIFRSFDKDGIEFSGGEQQKLAIGRALYKNSPIVILDEPTAALDPIAEYEIYKQFNTLIGGKTTFYISHRLSSCQFCDKIALFSDGIIKEYGTHDELVSKKDGLYAKMFQAQAQYYK